MLVILQGHPDRPSDCQRLVWTNLRVSKWILNELLDVLAYCINAAQVSIADGSGLCSAEEQSDQSDTGLTEEGNHE